MPTADEQVVVDGQRALAVSEVSGDFIYDGGATDPYCIVDNNGTAQRALKVANVGEGGGGGGTVDQTYDPTSTNAQSGTAVAEAVAPALKNTATGTNSFSIGPTTGSTGSKCISIGKEATTSTYNSAVAIGNSATAQNSAAIAVGSQAKAWGVNSVAVGSYTFAYSIQAIAIGGGNNPASVNANYAIQIGEGSNSTANSFQVYSYQMLDGTTGLIPAARIGTGYDATKTQVLKNVNGTLTWVDE